MSDLQTDPRDMRQLLGPLGAERFFADYWGKHAVAFQLETNFFERLLQETGALDIERLAAAARNGTQAWMANEHIAHSVVPVDASNARMFFEAGASLYFINVPLEAVTKPLAAFLGAPPARILASFFLTPAGGGASPHFDAHENFTIQLTGAKRWTVGTRPLIAAAPEGHVLGSRVKASLAGLLDGYDAAPRHTVKLEPGALLYIPRGTVHNTEAGEMSWSLNLSYACTMWLDLVCTGLKRRLASSERWRGTVTGLGNPDPAAGAANALPRLADELRGMLADTEELNLLFREFFTSHDPGPH